MARKVFLKAPFDGGSTTKGYEKWIELFSFSWGNERAITLRNGRLTPGKLALGPIAVSKAVDAATADIAKGTFLNELLTLQLAVADDVAGVRILDMTFEGALFQSQSMSGAEEIPNEQVMFQFAKVTGVVRPIDSATGKAQGPFTWFYDQVTGKGG